MTDLLTALALVLVIEGLMLAVFADRLNVLLAKLCLLYTSPSPRDS